MKVQYTNKTNSMKQIMFKDKSSVFLKRGQSHTSDKEVTAMGKGIVTKEVRPTKRKTTETTQDTSE